MMENNQGMGDLARLAAAVAVATLAACGGGGDDDGGSVVRVSDGDRHDEQGYRQRQRTSTTRWMPAATDTWQLQLQGKLNTSVQRRRVRFRPLRHPAGHHRHAEVPRQRVVCYFSAGSSENWRSDYSQFTAADQGHPLDGWAGERWLDTRSANVRKIMTARMDLAKAKGAMASTRTMSTATPTTPACR